MLELLLIGGSAVASGALTYWVFPTGGKGGGKVKPLPSPVPMLSAPKPKEPEFERVLCDCPEYTGTDFWNDPHRWCDTDPVTQRIWEDREFKNCERTVRPKRVSALDKLETALNRLDNIERIRKERQEAEGAELFAALSGYPVCKCNNSVYDYMCDVHGMRAYQQQQMQGLLGSSNQQQSNLGGLLSGLAGIGHIF